jgi:16S rRNA (guanine966-N2)-methyltransferase
VRIISGTYKGKRLTAPKSLPVRPTTDFAKEGLFNILANRIDFHEVSLLDLFAGTGNISFEFASRGCPSVTSVDSHHGCVGFIKKTSEALQFPIRTVKADVFKYISAPKGSYDIVFADPPYAFSEEEFTLLIDKTIQNNFINSSGILIIEHSKHTDLSGHSKFSEMRRYGGSVFSFFES